MTDGERHPIVFFDGVCAMCNSSVNHLMASDRKRVLRYSPLQGETAKRLLPERYRGSDESLETMIVLDERGLHERSSALLAIVRHLGGIYRLLLVFTLLPRPLRDALYNFIARNRYRWFGKRETCRLPSPEERALFLD